MTLKSSVLDASDIFFNDAAIEKDDCVFEPIQRTSGSLVFSMTYLCSP